MFTTLHNRVRFNFFESEELKSQQHTQGYEPATKRVQYIRLNERRLTALFQCLLLLCTINARIQSDSAFISLIKSSIVIGFRITRLAPILVSASFVSSS
jgi:hypothetical protein